MKNKKISITIRKKVPQPVDDRDGVPLGGREYIYTQRDKYPALYIYQQLCSASYILQLYGAKFGASSKIRLIGLRTSESVKLALLDNQKPGITRLG
jgi:hypothetical protein